MASLGTCMGAIAPLHKIHVSASATPGEMNALHCTDTRESRTSTRCRTARRHRLPPTAAAAVKAGEHQSLQGCTPSYQPVDSQSCISDVSTPGRMCGSGAVRGRHCAVRPPCICGLDENPGLAAPLDTEHFCTSVTIHKHLHLDCHMAIKLCLAGSSLWVAKA